VSTRPNASQALAPKTSGASDPEKASRRTVLQGLRRDAHFVWM
jgi:hypothetical protein